MNRPPKRVLGALAIVTGCSLTFQVALTRTLAAMLAYHYGFLAISLSLLGIGAAGLYVYVRPDWFERRSLERALATWSLIYAVALDRGAGRDRPPPLPRRLPVGCRTVGQFRAHPGDRDAGVGDPGVRIRHRRRARDPWLRGVDRTGVRRRPPRRRRGRAARGAAHDRDEAAGAHGRARHSSSCSRRCLFSIGTQPKTIFAIGTLVTGGRARARRHLLARDGSAQLLRVAVPDQREVDPVEPGARLQVRPGQRQRGRDRVRPGVGAGTRARERQAARLEDALARAAERRLRLAEGRARRSSSAAAAVATSTTRCRPASATST